MTFQTLDTRVLLQPPMQAQVVVMPDAEWVDLSLLRTVVREYGWSVRVANNLIDIKQIQEVGRISALLFQEGSLKGAGSWLETITTLKIVAPATRMIACSHFSDSADFPKLCRAGLFHAIWLPLKEHEVKQCMGFVWEAERRLSLVNRPAAQARLAKAAS